MPAVILVIAVGVLQRIWINSNTVFFQVASAIQWQRWFRMLMGPGWRRIAKRKTSTPFSFSG